MSLAGGEPPYHLQGKPRSAGVKAPDTKTMEVQPQRSPKRKEEPAMEEKLVQLDDLRTLLKEER